MFHEGQNPEGYITAGVYLKMYVQLQRQRTWGGGGVGGRGLEPPLFDKRGAGPSQNWKLL